VPTTVRHGLDSSSDRSAGDPVWPVMIAILVTVAVRRPKGREGLPGWATPRPLSVQIITAELP
jgi:hypothetical protein